MPGFALRNPHTVIVGALVVVLLGVTAFARMPVDVFPNLKMPAVVVATFYPGMPPLEIERDITTRFERFFTLASDIEHIESRSLPGVSIIRVFFNPDANVDAAAASIANLAMADLRHLPPGTLPPLVLKSDASSLPVTLVTVAGEGFSEAQLRDQAQYNVRNQLATVAGASVPPPFGGKYRQIMVYADRKALEARGLTPMDVVHSLNDANLIIPAGDAKIGNIDYFVRSNSMIEDPTDIDHVPVRVGAGQAPVLVGDVAHAEDAAQIQQNVVRIDGQRSVYVPVLKQGNANTIAVVDGVRDLLPKVFGLPAGMHLQSIFDQSGYIREAIESLQHEAASAAVLASLVILLFLGSYASTLAIFLSIPLSVLAAAFGLFLNGSTTNVMTLGGFALAIGRLVDNSVVVLENISRHLAQGQSPTAAARDGADEVALPVLASTVTTVIVFFPVMFLFGVTKYLFGALSLAVVLSMLASYVVAMTVIPIYCARFLTTDSACAEAEGSGRGLLARFGRTYERFADRYERLLERMLEHKAAVITAVGALFVGAMIAAGGLGTELFPRTDAGQFIINLRTPPGSRIEVTEALTQQVEQVVRTVIPSRDLGMVVSNLGLAPGFSAIYSPNAASDSGFVMVSLAADHHGSTASYMAALREALQTRVPDVRAFFQSGQYHRRGAELRAGGPDRPPAQRAGLHGAAHRRAAGGRRGAPVARGGRRVRAAGVGISDLGRRGGPRARRPARPQPAGRGDEPDYRTDLEPDDRSLDLDRPEERERLLPHRTVPGKGHQLARYAAQHSGARRWTQRGPRRRGPPAQRCRGLAPDPARRGGALQHPAGGRRARGATR